MSTARKMTPEQMHAWIVSAPHGRRTTAVNRYVACNDELCRRMYVGELSYDTTYRAAVAHVIEGMNTWELVERGAA
jgi:hypothetical protein